MSVDTVKLSPQTALEQALLEAIRAALPGWSDVNSGRMHDGRPKAIKSGLWLSVWSRGDRTSDQRSCLRETFGLAWTLTVHGGKRPRDRWAELRDDLHLRMDAIRAVVHQDSRDGRIVRAADALMAREVMDGLPGSVSATKRVGFQRGLMFAGFDPIEDRGAEWFGAETGGVAGFCQTGRATGALLIQDTPTAG